MRRLRTAADWPEQALRALLWRLEARLAVTTAALLAVIAVVAVFWWDSSDEVRNFGLLAGGVVAVALAIWRSRVAERQAATAEAARLDAQFELGLRMLQDEREMVQLDGMSMLDRLLAEYPDTYGPLIADVMDRRLDRLGEGGADDDR